MFDFPTDAATVSFKSKSPIAQNRPVAQNENVITRDLADVRAKDSGELVFFFIVVKTRHVFLLCDFIGSRCRAFLFCDFNGSSPVQLKITCNTEVTENGPLANRLLLHLSSKNLPAISLFVTVTDCARLSLRVKSLICLYRLIPRKRLQASCLFKTFVNCVQDHLFFSDLSYLVIDEADTMFDHSFKSLTEELLKSIHVSKGPKSNSAAIEVPESLW